MADLAHLPHSLEHRVRLEAARIHGCRRQITRSNALRDLDAQIVREATEAGLRRGEALSFADTIMDLVAARLAALDRLSGDVIVTRNVIPLRRAGAAA